MDIESHLSQIRDLESLVVASPKNASNVIKIEEILSNETYDDSTRLAALHSLRRIYLHFFEQGSFLKPRTTNADIAEKLEKYRSWLIQRYVFLKGELYRLVFHESVNIQAAVIRTMVELIRCENATLDLVAVFRGMSSFSRLIVSVLGTEEIDVDILLMMKEEVFSKVDCAFHTLVTINRVLEQEKIRLREQHHEESGVGESDSHSDKKLSTSPLVQNVFDMLRILDPPSEQDEIDEDGEFLCTYRPKPDLSAALDNGAGDASSDSDSEDEKNSGPNKGKKRTATTSASGQTSRGKKRRSKMALSVQAQYAECHTREFSKAWMQLLSFPMSQKTVKLVLKHLPENVIPFMQNPLLLADYLSTTVRRGGVVAVLAIESLFHMIVKYNLDYPHFFSALYDLCSPSVFAARYRAKFMRLLHRSLKSTNIPAYVAAAFTKKLVYLCLHIPAPPVMFCLTQAIWLLQHHPSCLTLLHVNGAAAGGPRPDPFDPSLPLEESGALSSQLYEVIALQHHYVREVAQLATALQNDSLVTAASTKSDLLDVEQYIDQSFDDMIRDSMKKNRKQCALNGQLPEDGVYFRSGAIADCLAAGKC